MDTDDLFHRLEHSNDRRRHAPSERRVVPSSSLDANDTSAVLGAHGGHGRRLGLRVLAVALLLGV